MKRLRLWLGIAAVLGAAGCTGGGKEEEQAFQELRAKPATDEQRAMIEKIKGNGPAPSRHAGATND